MNRSMTCLLFVTVALVISVECQHDAMLAPPGRPSEFRSPGQLKQYLKALNDYYAIVGRPRFGRSVDKQTLDQAESNDYIWNMLENHYLGGNDEGMDIFETESL